MEFAGEGDRARLAQHDPAALSRWEVDVEAVIGGRRRVAEEVAIDPQDLVADAKPGRDGRELHVLDLESIDFWRDDPWRGARGGCERQRRHRGRGEHEA